MEAIRNFDDEDSWVLRHCDNHFTDRFRFRGRAQSYPIEFGDTVNHRSDFFAEIRSELLQRVLGVLNCVME